MKRREFAFKTSAAAVLASNLWAGAAQANANKPVAGTDYLVLEPPAPVEAPADKIEVLEFFWYNCPHCNAFEAGLNAWAKKLPKDVYFRRVPVAFREEFVPQQRLYYALEAMGLVDKLHAKVFAAIHAEKQKLNDADAIAAWVGKQGVDTAKFSQQFNSFGVVTKANKARKLQDLYQIQGVPSLGVAGRFYVDGELARNNMETALKIVDALVATVRSGK
ncbi:MAG: thiol:disulfide interchange protein DsbA/DsbL [Rhodoferax sp.]|nr:thiol:disulfide interchange protein DsbA/DsbL [Rhodoferax sp.]